MNAISKSWKNQGTVAESWSSLKSRCRIISSVRGGLATRKNDLIAACENEQRTDPCETLASELIPLCDALRFIGRKGVGILRDRRVGWIGRPLWLWGVRASVSRVAHGRVLILAAWNYPLLLPGVQLAQALAAGNKVLIKPAPGCERATELMVQCFHEAGVPREMLLNLPSDVESATRAIDQGVDMVVLTGGADTGRAVMRRASETLTPTIMELGGCDAMLVLSDADLGRVARALRFGLTFNGGATCIGPRRVFA
ncbi:MAG: aldehyde dehydrogenase family protein, partial [Planctomycetota bacterium]